MTFEKPFISENFEFNPAVKFDQVYCLISPDTKQKYLSYYQEYGTIIYSIQYTRNDITLEVNNITKHCRFTGLSDKYESELKRNGDNFFNTLEEALKHVIGSEHISQEDKANFLKTFNEWFIETEKAKFLKEIYTHFKKGYPVGIVFLDIDGVLNSELFFSAQRFLLEEKKITVADQLKINPVAVELINTLGPANIYVVLTSDWGLNNNTLFELKKAGLSPDVRIVGETEKFNKLMEYHTVKGNEIAHWIDKNIITAWYKYTTETNANPEMIKLYVHYCIIDDEPCVLYEHRNNFVLVNSRTGLTEEDWKKVAEVLRK